MKGWKYISKRYYVATMYACRLIEEYGRFDNSINVSAIYYGVDKDKLTKLVKTKQKEGKKRKN